MQLKGDLAMKKRDTLDKSDKGSLEDVEAHIIKEFAALASNLRDTEASWFNEDYNYKASMNEVLELKTAGLQTLE